MTMSEEQVKIQNEAVVTYAEVQSYHSPGQIEGIQETFHLRRSVYDRDSGIY
jgi:hypothetical protein